MSYVDQEIASQPECWRRAAEVVATGAAGELPQAGERVAVIGCGTSLYIAQSYAVLRERAGQGETDAWAASEFPTGRGYDRVVAITRSGTTTEVLDALRNTPARTVAITADGTTPVKDAADALIVLDFADERSVVQTRFATTTLTLLRAHLGDDVEPLCAKAFELLTQPLPDDAVNRTQFTFLGAGATVGLANEAALKLREAAQAWTESYPGMEYRHGPISITDERSLVWVFGPAPAGLVDEVKATGAAVRATDNDAQVELVLAQRLAVELARARGLDPDHPRNLERSVILN
ncbi:fructoselysine-6-P-deglycase FrlB-like protein [Herbihabitans rhizosphaerae]|uniref:Fructoselysine-6-P-deglycase FrlB-like protein n=1 Tax=Herbihabitans rhizosphaerae TaxID=1872711 RepID=A0A4Q7L7H2_9PSEU|nr:sugar isomerase [Herbihabitans rhizosphaerae]RZS44840.1 fructoselysine-6-P-deglycase FrlB-like protein [Herbihabitans rhizosphaerae]